MDRQYTFFQKFLEGYKDSFHIGGNIPIENFTKNFKHITSLINTEFLRHCEEIGFKNFQTLQIEFFRDNIEIEMYGNKIQVNKTIFYQVGGKQSKTIFVNMSELHKITSLFGTYSGIIFLLSHEYAHGIQDQFGGLEKDSCERECHANYIAGYLMNLLKQNAGMDIDIEEVGKLCSNHGTILDIKGVLGKHKKTHFNGIESKRSFQEGSRASLEEFLNTFPASLKGNISYKFNKQKSNFSGPEFYNF